MLDHCNGLHVLTLDLPHLRLLSLVGCRGLAELVLRCRALQHLTLGPATRGGIGSTSLHKVGSCRRV